MVQIIGALAGQARKRRRHRSSDTMAGVTHGGFSRTGRYIAMDGLDTPKVRIPGSGQGDAGDEYHAEGADPHADSIWRPTLRGYFGHGESPRLEGKSKALTIRHARSSQLYIHQDPDEVLAVALRTAVGVQGIAADQPLTEAGIVPIEDLADFVIVEYSERHALRELHGHTDSCRVHPISIRGKATPHRGELARIHEGARRRGAVIHQAACIDIAPIQIERGAVDAVTQCRAGRIVALVVGFPPATGERIKRATELAAGRGVARAARDARQSESGVIIADIGSCAVGRRRGPV